MAGFDTNILFYNQGRGVSPNFNFMLRVEGIFDLPCRRVHSFTKANEYEYIQEGGLNDYVHMRRKPISQPFTFQVERYVGVDYIDPLGPGADLILPIVLMVWRMQMNSNFTPFRIYTFTGCNVMSKEYGELNAEQSGLLVETTTIGYREMVRLTMPDNMADGAWFKYDFESGENKHAAHPENDSDRAERFIWLGDNKDALTQEEFDAQTKNMTQEQLDAFRAEHPITTLRGNAFASKKGGDQNPNLAYKWPGVAEGTKPTPGRAKSLPGAEAAEDAGEAAGEQGEATGRPNFSDGVYNLQEDPTGAKAHFAKRPANEVRKASMPGERPNYSNGVYDLKNDPTGAAKQFAKRPKNDIDGVKSDPTMAYLWGGASKSDIPPKGERANKVRGAEAAKEASSESNPDGTKGPSPRPNFSDGVYKLKEDPTGATTHFANRPANEVRKASMPGERPNFSDGVYDFKEDPTGANKHYAKRSKYDEDNVKSDPKLAAHWEGASESDKPPKTERAKKLEAAPVQGDRSKFSDGLFAFGPSKPTYATPSPNDPTKPEHMAKWDGSAPVRGQKLENGGAGGDRSSFNDGEFSFGGKSPDYAKASPTDSQRAENVLWQGGGTQTTRARKLEGSGGGKRDQFSNGEFRFGPTKPTYAKVPQEDGKRAESVLWEGFAGPVGSKPATKRAMIAELLK